MHMFHHNILNLLSHNYFVVSMFQRNASEPCTIARSLSTYLVGLDPIVFFLFCIRLAELVNSTKISQAWLKVTESFSVSSTHSWLCGVVVKTPDLESVGCEFKYRIFCFWKEKSSLISLILNTKSEKHDWHRAQCTVWSSWISWRILQTSQLWSQKSRSPVLPETSRV